MYNVVTLFAGSDDHTVRIWDCVNGSCLHTIITHTVADLKFDEQSVITASYDTTAACWNVANHKQEMCYVGHVAAIFGVDFNRVLDIVGMFTHKNIPDTFSKILLNHCKHHVHIRFKNCQFFKLLI